MKYAPAAFLLASIALPAAAQAPAPPMPPQQELVIRLPVAAWNTVLQGLLELPMKTAQPIVQSIQDQAKTQMEPPKADNAKK